MALSYKRFKADIMDEYTKEEMFDFIMSMQPIAYNEEFREYHVIQSARKQLLLFRQRSINQFPERKS